MNFSNTIKYSSSAKFSPNGYYLALIRNDELLIYESTHVKQVHKFSFAQPFNIIEWSPDSSLILCGIFKSTYVEIKSLDNPEWQCKINEGFSGLNHIKWVPDSRKLISSCEFNIKLSVWSLIDKTFSFINNPKFNDDKCAVFSNSGLFAAIPERKDLHDYVGIYSISDFTLVTHFLSESVDMCDIKWSYDNTSIIIVDYPIESKIYIYSPLGEIEATIEPCLKGSFGINPFTLSPNSEMLATTNEQSIKLFDSISWQNFATLNHLCYKNKNKKHHIFKEEEITVKDQNGNVTKGTKFVECENISSITQTNSNGNKGKLKGIKKIEWSSDSKYLVYKNDNYPNMLWVWKTDSLELISVIITNKNIRDFKWSPSQNSNNKNTIVNDDNFLIIVTENQKIYLYSTYTISTIEIPCENFNPTKVQWNMNGTSVLLCDKNNIVLGYLDRSLL